MSHIPVLLQEVVSLLKPIAGEVFADGTLGGGGHSQEILKKLTPGGTLLAVDRDQRAVNATSKTLVSDSSVRLLLEAGSYAEIPALMEKFGIKKLDGLFLDLGFSSEQIIGGTLSGRGFSFMTDEPLLMTYDDSIKPLAEVLSELSVPDLASIIREYGEERYADEIAKSIATMARREGIATTGQLVKAIKSAVPSSYEGGRIDPATRTFQALRIYVNQELSQLEKLMMALPKIMAPGGRVVVISFHSIEDRMVKQFFAGYTHGEKVNKYADRSRGGSSVRGANLDAHAGELPNTSSASSPSGKSSDGSRKAEILTKKPVTASEAELEANPRARSAKVRGIVFN